MKGLIIMAVAMILVSCRVATRRENAIWIPTCAERWSDLV